MYLGTRLQRLIPIGVFYRGFFASVLCAFYPIIEGLRELSNGRSVMNVIKTSGYVAVSVRGGLPRFFSMAVYAGLSR